MRLEPHPRTRIFCLLAKIMFSPLRIVALGLPADALYLFDLSRLAGGLNVLEVHLQPLHGLMSGQQSPPSLRRQYR
jgi:hypothetical protein